MAGEVPAFAVEAAVGPELGKAASTKEKSAAVVAGAVPAVAAEEATQAPVAVVEGVELHTHPVAAVEFLRVVAADPVVALAVGGAVGVVAGAVDLHRKGFDFHRGPFVERDGPSK